MSFFIKTSSPEDWKSKLADPKHWKPGCSARTLAYSWMEAKGFPKSVKAVFQKSDYPLFKNIEFLLGFDFYLQTFKWQKTEYNNVKSINYNVKSMNYFAYHRLLFINYW